MINQPKTSDRQYYMFALKIMGDFGIAIAAPLVVMVLLGQWLDEKYNLTPLFTILGFAIAALASIRIIYKKTKIYGEQYKKMGEGLNKDKK